MSLTFAITGDNSNLLNSLDGAKRGVRRAVKDIEESGMGIEDVFNRIKSVASIAFAGFSAKEIVSTLANVRGEFQQNEIAFETMLGSAGKAKTMIADLANLAATTPFDMKGVVSGAKSLLAYGFAADEVTDTMRRLGDVCAGLGLNLQDMAWLYGTTMVQGRLFTQDFRQFTGRGIPLADELAKQFGVTKDEVQELVTAGKVGFPEVKKALESMTNEGGKFGGLMEKQSHSITGQIANIQDTIEMAINDLGTQTEGIMSDALAVTSTVVDHWKEIGEVILAAASAMGLYKAMTVGVSAFGAATANAGYDAELSALEALLPVKEEAKKSDLEEAMAKGQLSASQAELVTSMREEAAAYVSELQAKAKAAQDNVHSLENRLAAEEVEVDTLQKAYDNMESYTDGLVRETKEAELNTAVSTRNATAKKLQAAREEAATAATEANTAAQGLNTAATARDSAAKSIHVQFTLLCKKAQDAWNASMFASPLFWLAATIAGVSFAVYKLVTAETAHEAAVRKSNEAWDEFDKKTEERRMKIENLIRTIQSETATEYDKAEAYQKLSKLAPQLTEEYSQMQLASADFAKTQKEVAESMNNLKYDQAVAEVEKCRLAIESLNRLIVADGKENGGGQSLLLTRQLLQAKEDMEQARKMLYDIVLLRNQAAENAKPIEVRLEEAKENESVRREIFNFYDEAITLANDWQSANETVNFATGETRFDEFIAKAERDIEGLRKDMEKKPADVRLRLKYEEKTKVLHHLLDMKADWSATGATTIPLIFKADWQSAQQSLNQAKNKAQALANSDSAESYAQAYTKAQKSYNAAKKKVATMEKNKAKYTAAEYTKATKDLKAAKDAFSKLGGDVDGKSAKKENTARKKREKEVEEQEKLSDLQDDLALNRIRTSQDLEQRVTKARISAMVDGAEKTRQIQEQQNKEEIDALKRQKEDAIRKYIEEEERLFDQQEKIKKAQNDNYKKKKFDRDSVDTSSIAKQYDDIISLTLKQQETQSREESLSAMRDYLKEYGSIEEQRLAVTQEYERKIAEARTQGEKMSLQRQMEEALSGIDMTALKKDINWERVFNDLDTVSAEHLRALKGRLKETLGADNVSAENAKVIAEQIDRINGQITSKQNEWRSAFGLVVPELERIRMLKQEEAEAQERLNELQERQIALELERADIRAQIAVHAGANGVDVGGKDITAGGASEIMSLFQDAGKDTRQLSEMFLKLGKSEAALAGNTEALSTAQTDAAAAGAKAARSFAGTVAVIDKIIHAVDDNVRSADELTGQLGLSDTAFGKGFSSFAKSSQYATEAWESLKSGDIMGVANGVIGSLSSLGDALGEWGIGFFGSSDTSLLDDVERLTQSNEALRKSIDILADKMADGSVVDAESIYKQQLESFAKSEANTLELMQRSANVYSNGFFGIGGKKSSSHKINENLSASEWGRISQLLGKSVRSATDFFNLSSGQMYKVAAELPDIYAHIKDLADNGYGDAAKFMDEYIDYWGRLQELEEAYLDKLTSTSFDNIQGDFANALMDMDSDAEDFADNFEEYMQQAIVNALVSDQYKPMLEKWYKAFAHYMTDGKISEGEMEALREKGGSYYDQTSGQYVSFEGWKSMSESALADRDAMKDLFGWNTPYSQEASSKGFQAMSQDTGDELNGRFTAIQISGDVIAEQAVQIYGQMITMTAIQTSSNNCLIELRNMMITANGYLEDTAKYSKKMYLEFGEKLDSMIDNTKNL